MSEEEYDSFLDTDAAKLLMSSADTTIESEIYPPQIIDAQRGRGSDFAVVTFQFGTWNPDHLHWESPSNAIFYASGRIYLYAKRIAHHRRPGFLRLDTTYRWQINYQYLNSEGIEIQASTLNLATLKFNKTKDDADSEKVDGFLRDNLDDITSVRVTRRIVRIE